MAKDKVCCICGSENASEFNNTSKYYCIKHYGQLNRYGVILDRTKFDKNEIILYEGYAEIVLYDKNHKETAKTLIDLDDVEKVKEYKWYLNKQGYVASSNINSKVVRLHNFILNNNDENFVIDHINRDKLNNKKSNLRIADKSLNSINKSIQCNNKSGVTGVCWCKRRNRWRSRIIINKKEITLGYFIDFDEAVKTRLNAEVEYLGFEFSPQKYLFDKYNIINC